MKRPRKATQTKKPSAAAHPDPSLKDLQHWVQAVITHPEGAEAGIASRSARGRVPVTPAKIEDVVTPSKNLSGLERIDLYAGMYFARLVEALEQDYPAVRHAVGEERFEVLARSFVTAHPSRHYNLALLGRPFPAFLAETSEDLAAREFLVELATLERAIEECFDAPEAKPLAYDELLGLPVEQWAGARFEFIPAFRLLRAAWPVQDYRDQVREEKAPALPSPREDRVAVYRRDYMVRRISLAPIPFAILAALKEGQTLGAALEAGAALSATGPEAIAPAVGPWFKEWTAKGLFASVSPGKP